LKVAISARFVPSLGAGGVESVVLALVRALGRLDGPEEYAVLTHPDAADWLRPYLGPNQHILVAPTPHDARRSLEGLKRLLGPLRPMLRSAWRSVLGASEPSAFPWIEQSDGFLESLGCAVVHIPYQCYTLSSLPTVYNPHDLQHLHLPQFFEPAAIARRETVYRAACDHAHTVAVGSGWVKHDIEQHYGVPAAKIQVIPWAPPTQVFDSPTPGQLDEIRSRYALPSEFAYYPAMIWEHKNHLRLLEALALLRDRDRLTVNLVCTGAPYPPFWPRVAERLRGLGLDSQVRFLGMVPADELRSLYRLARFVVVPTLFEAASGPVFEAWQEGVPVACSTVTSLPEQAGSAAVLFDPLSVDAIADAVRRMATDAILRADLVRQGTWRLRDFSWERTARAYRAVYRRAAGLALSEEDRDLLAWDWAQWGPESDFGERT
jgi:glycosyltransferase involved in cell wall biosynthesis